MDQNSDGAELNQNWIGQNGLVKSAFCGQACCGRLRCSLDSPRRYWIKTWIRLDQNLTQYLETAQNSIKTAENWIRAVY